MNESIAYLWNELDTTVQRLLDYPENHEATILLQNRQVVTANLLTAINAQKNIADADLQKWIYLAIFNSVSDVFKTLVERKPAVLQNLYTIQEGSAYTWSELALHIHDRLESETYRDFNYLQGMRDESNVLSAYLKQHKVPVRNVFLESHNQTKLTPKEGVENTFLMKSVSDSYIKLLHRYGYLLEGKRTPAEKKYYLFRNEHRRSLEAFVNQLTNPAYVAEQGWDFKIAKHAHAILKSVLMGKKYIKEEKAYNKEIRRKRVALYRDFTFLVSQHKKKFSLKDLVVVLWQAMNDEEFVRNIEQRKNLHTAFVQAMYEADALAHDAGASSLMIGTNFGCSNAVVYAISALRGVHPDVAIQYFNAEAVALKGMTIMSRWIANNWKQHPGLKAQITTWIVEGGMDESLLESPMDFLAYLRPQLEKEYEGIEGAAREITVGLSQLKSHNIPPILEDLLFKDFAQDFLKERFSNLSLTERGNLESVVNTQGVVKDPTLMQDWHDFLERDFFSQIEIPFYKKTQKEKYEPMLDKILNQYLQDKQYLLDVLQTTAQASGSGALMTAPASQESLSSILHSAPASPAIGSTSPPQS